MPSYKIQMWAQILFTDGSVSKNVRVDADILDDEDKIKELCSSLLCSVNRDTGLFVIWGAGSIFYQWVTPNIESTSSGVLVLESDS